MLRKIWIKCSWRIIIAMVQSLYNIKIVISCVPPHFVVHSIYKYHANVFLCSESVINQLKTQPLLCNINAIVKEQHWKKRLKFTMTPFVKMSYSSTHLQFFNESLVLYTVENYKCVEFPIFMLWNRYNVVVLRSNSLTLVDKVLT